MALATRLGVSFRPSRSGSSPSSTSSWRMRGSIFLRSGSIGLFCTTARLDPEELARREGRHSLRGMRDAGRGRELPCERSAEARRLAPGDLEVALAARESVGALPHRLGLGGKLVVRRIVVALAEKHREVAL